MTISDFKSMYPSRLEVTDTGKKLLVVYYDDKKLDWDKAIEWARRHYKLSKPVQTIAIAQCFRQGLHYKPERFKYAEIAMFSKLYGNDAAEIVDEWSSLLKFLTSNTGILLNVKAENR